MKRIIFLSFLTLLLIAPPTSHAFTMENDNYIIRMGNFNMLSGQSESSKHKLTQTAGENVPGLYTGKNYKIRAGFAGGSGRRNPSSFSFTLSQNTIDFGILSATNPVIRTTNLTIASPASPYQVLGSEDHALLSASNAVIPDTTCDNGSCTEITSAEWSNTLTYGFGYRCEDVKGTGCASAFSDPNSYRQFADRSKGETPQPVMASDIKGKNDEAKILYKVNIPGTQQTGSYSNEITFIATPTF